MKKIIPLILLWCLSVGVSLSSSRERSSAEDSLLLTMFSYANSHNVGALETLNDQIKLKNDRLLTAAYSLALYIGSPEKYKQEYVDKFPVDSEGIQYFYEQIELKNLTPTFLYSIDAIGLIAEEGNRKAIEKVIIGFNYSDGGVAELFCDTLMRLFEKQLPSTIRAFSRIDEGFRKKAYSCLEIMSEKEFKSLKAKAKKMEKEATGSEIKVIREIDNYR